MQITVLEATKATIVRFFDAGTQRVYRFSDLATVFELHRRSWHLPANMGAREFADTLLKVGMKKLKIFEYPTVNRYLWRDATRYELALSIRPKSFLSHGTAATLHGLIDPDRHEVFVNREQSPKPKSVAPLTQEAIDLAFTRKQRTSAMSFTYEGRRITLVEGQNTGRLGIEAWQGLRGERFEYTCLERTLIDIAVRPLYAGGIQAVLQAYSSAKKRVLSERLLSLLQAFNFRYPYHQAIGFLMERSGYASSDWESLLRLGSTFRFYLRHSAEDLDFDSKWQLYFPRTLGVALQA